MVITGITSKEEFIIKRDEMLLDNNIKYDEHIAVHVDNNIKYTKYVGEHRKSYHSTEEEERKRTLDIDFINMQSQEKTDLGTLFKENNIEYGVNFSKIHRDSWYEIEHKNIRAQISTLYDTEIFINILLYLSKHVEDEEFDSKKIMPHFMAMLVKRENNYWDDDIYCKDIIEFGNYFKKFREKI